MKHHAITTFLNRQRRSRNQALRDFADARGRVYTLTVPSMTRNMLCELIQRYHAEGVRVPRSLRCFLKEGRG